jgi:hypothetical protein
MQHILFTGGKKRSYGAIFNLEDKPSQRILALMLSLFCEFIKRGSDGRLETATHNFDKSTWEKSFDEVGGACVLKSGPPQSLILHLPIIQLVHGNDRKALRRSRWQGLVGTRVEGVRGRVHRSPGCR